MRRIIRTVGIMLLCGALLAPAADARGRNESTTTRKSTPSRTHQSVGGASAQPAARPVQQATRPAQPSVSRPGNSGQGSAPSTRPGNNGLAPGTTRPGNNGRPSGGNNTGNRPGATPPSSNNNRPSNPSMGGGAPGGPIGGQRPDYRPAPPPPGPHRPGFGPARPNMPPVPHGWYRPTPPPSWRPPVAWRPFRSILGIAFGTTINISINALINSGYTVSHYGDNSVFVNNVPMLNMMWPDAVLYYNNAGGLCGSRFIYGSGFYDMTRYNSVYATLVSTYGSPYSVQNTASGIEANWWGTGNQFITLSFAPQYANTGAVVYYTTLSFGN